MSQIFKKLNLKDHKEILVVNAPDSFEPELLKLDNISVRRELEEVEDITFSLAFVTKQEEVNSLARAVAEKVKGDAVVWFAFPKGSSKKYKCEFNRDTGWEELGKGGFEPVRLVAIDEDWSALRFRKVEYIKGMKRDQKMALSEKGKERLEKKDP
jgi:hypothetical protein